MEQNQNQAPSPSLPPKKSESRVFSYIRTCFLTGILVTAPVALSLYFVWSILLWVDETVGHIVPIHLMGEDSIPGLGIIMAVGFFILVGWFARNFIGVLMLKTFDYILERLPLVKTSVWNADGETGTGLPRSRHGSIPA